MARSTPSTSNGTTRTPTASWCAAATPAANGSAPIAIDDGNWDHYSPTIVARGNGALAIWSGQSKSGFDLFAAEISPDGKVSKPERLTTRPVQRLQRARRCPTPPAM